jgi:hypothetical protein
LKQLNWGDSAGNADLYTLVFPHRTDWIAIHRVCNIESCICKKTMGRSMFSFLRAEKKMWQLLLYLTTHGGIVERLKRVLGVQSGKG